MVTVGSLSGRTLAIASTPQSVRQPIRCASGRLLCSAVIVAGLVAGVMGVCAQAPGIVERELERRAQITQQAQQSLLAGDKAYRLADYATAVDEFTKAFNLFPGGTGTSHLKAAAADRLAQASVERARELARVGDYRQADELLENVLKTGASPNHAAATEMRERLKDPIRNNPALTPEHARNVDEVRRLLYEAKGFEQLGQFDRAIVIYNAVLRIDPHNSAARRGMEVIHNHKANYSDSARDEARALLLSEVAGAWESPAPKKIGDLAGEDFGVLKGQGLLGASSTY